MGKYLARRVIALIAIIFVVSLGTSFLIHLLPGNPATVVLGLGATPPNVAAFNHQYGLDKPMYLQYFVWMNNIIHGNLGESFISHTQVIDTIFRAMPIDIELIILSQVMAFGIAIPLAMRSARKPDGLVDRMLSGASFGLLSVPPFVMIVLLVLVVSIKWRIPHTGPASFVPFAQNPVVNLMSLALPSFVLALTSFIVYYRVLRADMIATLQEEFITMARSKGISRRRIFWRHAFRPSSVSLIGTAGVNIGGLLAGGFVIQYLLAIPGLGYMLVIGIGSSDFVLVQGIVLFISIFVVLINFLFDFIVTLVDPRIARD